MYHTTPNLKTIAALIAQWKQQVEGRAVAVPEWILPPRSCEFLQVLCGVLEQPVKAFEFGSGRSSFALRMACASVTSVEDSAAWLAKTEAAPDAIPKRLSDMTGVIPLTRCWNRFRPIESFDLTSAPTFLTALKAAKFILVDSPPNPAKREHALFQALDHASVGALIVIDDLNVGATRRFCERLAHQNPATFAFWFLSFDHGLGVFLKLASASIISRPAFREHVGAWVRR